MRDILLRSKMLDYKASSWNLRKRGNAGKASRFFAANQRFILLRNPDVSLEPTFCTLRYAIVKEGMDLSAAEHEMYG